MKKIYLKKGKEDSVLRGHPWIFSGAISGKSETVGSGELVEVFDYKENPLGQGLYQQGRIAIKLFSGAGKSLDNGLITERISNAIDYRQRMGLPSPLVNGFRCVHGEADLLPGIIIDTYADTAVVHLYQAGLEHFIAAIAKGLRESALAPGYILVKQRTRGGEWQSEWINEKSPAGVLMVENGIRYTIDPEEGQKTGFFLDQRDNRKLLGQFADGKTVLNTFAYSGGFSLSAIMGGAKRVVSVEISRDAIAQMQKNFKINNLSEEDHVAIEADVFDHLSKLSSEENYDIIVLDPPAFAKSIRKRHNAVIAYKRLNALALKKLKPGGQLWTFSCSQVVNRNLFEDTLRAAVMSSGKSTRMVRRLGQPVDHPVAFQVPETEYLKGVVLEVI